MSEFKEEFSQLLLRYASLDATANNRTPDMPETPLTNQQILDAIHEVLRATLNINLQNIDAAALKTPANEIIMTTPDAPDVLRVDYNQSSALQTRYQSLADFPVEDDEDDIKVPKPSMSPSRSVETTKVSEKQTTPDKKSPVKTANATVQENKKDKAGSDKSKQEQKSISSRVQDILNQKFRKELPVDTSTNIKMYTIAEDAHKSAMKVINHLEDLKQLLQPETRPIRRLSAIMSLPILKHHQQQQQQQHYTAATSCSNVRTIQRAKALRRSLQANDEMPVTPTSSRLNLVSIPPLPSQKKVPAVASATAVNKSAASKLSLGQHNRSSSTSALTDSNKSAGSAPATSKSPSKCQTKNSKYAHVQSTIPKPSSSAVKRKVQ